MINLLDYPIKEKSRDRKIVIWGVGETCNWFEKNYKSGENIEICGYVDSDKRGKRNGIPILRPEEINPKDFFVIVTTNYKNFTAIELELRQMGFSEEYIYYKKLFENMVAYFRKTYESSYQFPDIECPNKDKCIRIRANGDVCTCCMAYESVYGNLYEQRFEEIWNSKRARISRLALENRTYVNCDKKRCPFLVNIEAQKIDYDRQEEWNYDEKVMAYPESIAPEIDTSCNLYCSSCRNEIFIDNNPYIRQYADMILEKIVHLPVRLLINTVGEPFASKHCKYIIYHEKTRKRQAISLYSNGTLLSPNMLDSLLEIYETVEISISIDASTKRTYEKLRRNGNFEQLCYNLLYISRKRREGRVSYLQFNYVLQMDNILEMGPFVQFAKNLGSDMITINGIEQWGHMSEREYREKSVIQNGKLKQGLEKYFSTELINDKNINFLNIANIIGAKPRFMRTI